MLGNNCNYYYISFTFNNKPFIMKRILKISFMLTLFLIIVSAVIKYLHFGGILGKTTFILSGVALMLTISLSIIYLITKISKT